MALFGSFDSVLSVSGEAATLSLNCRSSKIYRMMAGELMLFNAVAAWF